MSSSPVDIRSYGYAGGTTSTGTVVPAGGFGTILTLFDGAGTFLTDNDEGAGVAVNPTTALAADAGLTTTLGPGRYLVALTEYDHFLVGNLADGFAEAGHPNFTADPSFTTGGPCPGNLFRDISGTAGRCRNGNWTVDFVNAANSDSRTGNHCFAGHRADWARFAAEQAPHGTPARSGSRDVRHGR